MKISELLQEEKLDELTLGGIGRGISRVGRGVAGAVGTARGALAGFKQAAQTGYERGRAAAAGEPIPPSAGGGAGTGGAELPTSLNTAYSQVMGMLEPLGDNRKKITLLKMVQQDFQKFFGPGGRPQTGDLPSDLRIARFQIYDHLKNIQANSRNRLLTKLINDLSKPAAPAPVPPAAPAPVPPAGP